MPVRILIIENHPANQKLMAYLLRSQGYEVLTASTGEQGLEIVHNEEFDLILCDIRMPGIDGFEVARRLRDDPSKRHLLLVAVTALAPAGDKEKVLAAGFDGYILKAISPRLFLSQVQSLLSACGSKPVEKK